MAAYIQALSTAVPETVMTRARAAEVLRMMCPDPRTARRLALMLPHTGIERRYLAAMESQSTLDEPGGLYRGTDVQPCGPGMDARSKAFGEPADRLIRRVLAPLSNDGLERAMGLVTVSCTHATSPGLERAVFRHSTLRHDVDRWNLGFMGCSAALAALRLAHRSSIGGSMLAVACELSSLHFQYSADIEQLTANLLFADGAATVLLSDEKSPVRILHASATAIPEAADQMVWWAGDFGLRLALSPELPATLAEHLIPAVERMLGEAGMARSEIDHWFVHPGGPQILDAVEARLALPAGSLDLSRRILRDYGNMSSPTILFILRAAMEARLIGKAMLVAFGPGLTIEMVLLEITPGGENLSRGPLLSKVDEAS
ncbi:MAG TPA: 3-oxoacyl-[acyl-carrier-protein] synthase III C-terminal domain-containing protein [Phycisphaerae bacterium]|nr:3-oxoacyl-[acyl-carrier-protein] synthase III C-terminal domain-containing protein [Phycisphaerae bacterium]